MLALISGLILAGCSSPAGGSPETPSRAYYQVAYGGGILGLEIVDPSGAAISLAAAAGDCTYVLYFNGEEAARGSAEKTGEGWVCYTSGSPLVLNPDRKITVPSGIPKPGGGGTIPQGTTDAADSKSSTVTVINILSEHVNASKYITVIGYSSHSGEVWSGASCSNYSLIAMPLITGSTVEMIAFSHQGGTHPNGRKFEGTMNLRCEIIISTASSYDFDSTHPVSAVTKYFSSSSVRFINGTAVLDWDKGLDTPVYD
jgi:hypothetical protein